MCCRWGKEEAERFEIQENSQTLQMKGMCIQENDLLAHSFDIRFRKQIISENMTFRSDYKFIDVVEEIKKKFLQTKDSKLNEWYSNPNAKQFEFSNTLSQLDLEGKITHTIYIQEDISDSKINIAGIFFNKLNSDKIFCYSDNTLKELNVKPNDYSDYEKKIEQNSKKYFKSKLDKAINKRDEIFTMFAISYIMEHLERKELAKIEMKLNEIKKVLSKKIGYNDEFQKEANNLMVNIL